MALDIRDQEGDIWIWDFVRQTLTRLTFDRAPDVFPVWAPDSRRLLFASARAGTPNIFSQASDGTGAVERLTESSNAQAPQSVSPDGSRLVFLEEGQNTGRDIMVMTLQAERRVQPLVRTNFFEELAEISPDSRWLAYQSNESGRVEIYVHPFPDVNGGRWQVSTAGGMMPLWARNGQELFYVTFERSIMTVRVEQQSSSWRSGTPVKLFQSTYFHGAGTEVGRTFDVAPDGKRFLMIKQTGDNAPMPQNLVVVQNWHEELKRLVPTP
jgi:serine/threonine-protein kinase